MWRFSRQVRRKGKHLRGSGLERKRRVRVYVTQMGFSKVLLIQSTAWIRASAHSLLGRSFKVGCFLFPLRGIFFPAQKVQILKGNKLLGGDFQENLKM